MRFRNVNDICKLAVPIVVDAAAAIAIYHFLISTDGMGRRLGSPTLPRNRVSVKSIFARIGPRLGRRAYRMREDSFFNLHHILQKDTQRTTCARGCAPNGDITPDSSLSQAIRWFAGGMLWTLH